MKTFLTTSCLLAVTALPLAAQDEPAPSPGLMQQAVLSEQLIALGRARNDPVLMLAALRLRASLDDTGVAPADSFTDKESLLEAARAAAAGQDALLGLIEDAATEKGRTFCYPSWGRMICF
ncbi:hypothetical protein GCM10011534_07300 [Pseudooceanicola nanhaiensis]|uniref:Secreted protein n=1 Tax=Pseudooceanicola nanhaiensis TaxID=375761 RepID=A0A917WB69_9RHOB|nr:hypothetical protein [Pseudooceanicola nanhaiensis]GGL87826.1 hypothetical protein GCM10011534_07300 [Pseudooceanicola nanhaiensis]